MIYILFVNDTPVMASGNLKKIEKELELVKKTEKNEFKYWHIHEVQEV